MWTVDATNEMVTGCPTTGRRRRDPSIGHAIHLRAARSASLSTLVIETPFQLFHHLSMAMFGWESIDMLLYHTLAVYCEKRVGKICILTQHCLYVRFIPLIDVKITA